jgi:hypothetical protein
MALKSKKDGRQRQRLAEYASFSVTELRAIAKFW